MFTSKIDGYERKEILFQSSKSLIIRAIGWIHSHIAKSVKPPSSYELEIPKPISDIIMKLIEKAPDCRYQSAKGIRSDINRCFDEYKKFRQIKSFPLGTEDIPSNFQIPQKLYEREDDINSILSIFDKVRNGSTELILVCGASGVGSSFVFEAKFLKVKDGNVFLAKNTQRIPKNRFLKGIKILLVEDNYINQQLTEEMLCRVGASVDIAENGEEGVNLVKVNTYACVLMDVQMPLMDGYEVTKRIRNLPGAKGTVPVIALTANATKEDMQKSYDAKMDDHVSKPVNIDNLYLKLLSWVKPIVELEYSEDPIESRTDDNGTLLLLKKIVDLDLSTGLKRVGGNYELYKKLLCKFRDMQGENIKKIRTFLNNNEFDNAKKYLHTMKGLAGNLSATKVANIAYNLEVAIQEKNEDVDKLIDEYENSLEILVDSISDAFSSNSPVKAMQTVNIDKKIISEKIQHLYILIEKNSFQAENESELLQRELDGVEYADLVNQIVQLLSSFKFDSAKKILIELAKKIGVSLADL